MKRVTLAFTARDKFYVAAESLERIFEHTKIPFNLIIVDCNTPAKYWREIEAVIEGRPNVRVLREDRYLLPNESRNLAIPECQDELLCFIENDNLVGEGWLEQLIAALEEECADAAVPLLMEGRPGSKQPHFDDNMGYVHTTETAAGPRLEILPRPVKKGADVGTTDRRIEEFLETHVILFKREVFDKIGLFDPDLNASEEIDLSLSLRKAGLRICYDPKCVVHYILPSFPVPEEDRGLFEIKWNFQKVQESLGRIEHRWNLKKIPKNPGFMAERYFRGLGLLRNELSKVAPSREQFILVDNGQWVETEIVSGLNPVPFSEHNGEYWGPPKDDEAAICELERLRDLGAESIIFAWHALWYLDFYKEFRRHLTANYPCYFSGDLMMGFDLDAQGRETEDRPGYDLPRSQAAEQ